MKKRNCISIRILACLLLFLGTIEARCNDSTFLHLNVKYELKAQGELSVVGFASQEERDEALMPDSILVLHGEIKVDNERFKVKSINEDAFIFDCSFNHLIIEEGVESVGESAFYGCANLKSVSLPSTLSKIGKCAFSFCINLESISIDKNNPVFDSRDNCNAIIESHEDESELIMGFSNSTIPAGVTVIGEHAFDGCIDLREMIIPEGVEKIEGFAFNNCYNLKKVELPQSLVRIKNGCNFSNCTSLDSLYIPANVKEIPGGMMPGCTSLRRLVVDKHNKFFDSRNNCNAIVRTEDGVLVTGCQTSVIENGIKEIGTYSFSKMGVTTIHIPSSVEYVYQDAFSNNKNCDSISVDGGNAWYKSEGANCITERKTGVVVLACKTTNYKSRISTINEYAYMNSFPVVILPEGVHTIKSFAFSYCEELQVVFIPSSVKRIERNAFTGCKNLKTVVLLGNETEVDKDAFYGCDKLISK